MEKEFKVTARINEVQHNAIAKLIAEGKAKNANEAVQYIINKFVMFN